MLRTLRLPVAVSTGFVSSISCFQTPGRAQDYPTCYMVTSSGRIITLDYMCGAEARRKSIACQGPFDSDGFPVALAPELHNFRVAFSKTVKQQASIQDIDAEVQWLLDRVPFSTRTQELRQKLKFLNAKFQRAKSVEEADEISQESGSVMTQLLRDQCYSQIVQALDRKQQQLDYPDQG